MPLCRLVVLVALLVALLGARCAPPFQGFVLDAPLDETLFDDPSPTISAAGRVGSTYLLSSIDVWLDGVPLAGSLGLTPPFTDESGVVILGSGPVMVSDFDITRQRPRRVRIQLDGLALGSHQIQLRGSTAAATDTDEADVHLIGPMTLEAQGFASGGLPFGPQPGGIEGELANATLGQAAADGSVPFSNGDELRAGFVPIAEAIIMGSVP
jgi:hypothetical protein